MVYILLGTGFEEIEAIAPLDLMRRASICVTTVGVTGKLVTGSHGIAVEADILMEGQYRYRGSYQGDPSRYDRIADGRCCSEGSL